MPRPEHGLNGALEYVRENLEFGYRYKQREARSCFVRGINVP